MLRKWAEKSVSSTNTDWRQKCGFKLTLSNLIEVQEAAGSLNSGRSVITSLNWPVINLQSNYSKGNLIYTAVVSTMKFEKCYTCDFMVEPLHEYSKFSLPFCTRKMTS